MLPFPGMIDQQPHPKTLNERKNAKQFLVGRRHYSSILQFRNASQFLRCRGPVAEKLQIGRYLLV